MLDIRQQKGVSLYLTFMMMSILMVISFGISSILISEIRILRSMGHSVIAFYAAETGIEKTLYLDNNQIPEEGERGLCNICNLSDEWESCEVSGSDCDPLTCTNCTCVFYDEINGQRHDVEASVVTEEGASVTTIKSVGTYEQTKRAIQITRE